MSHSLAQGSDRHSVVSGSIPDWSYSSGWRPYDPGYFLSLGIEGTNPSGDITVRSGSFLSLETEGTNPSGDSTVTSGNSSDLTRRAPTDYTGYRPPMFKTGRFKGNRVPASTRLARFNAKSPQWTPQIQTALLLQHWHNAQAGYFENKCRSVSPT